MKRIKCKYHVENIKDVKMERIIFILLFLHCTNACPISCICKWKNGKQTVECVDKGLMVIPEGMDSGTQVLEFSGNNLKQLHAEKFLRMDLINLQRIYLSRCKIKIVDDGTFKGLTNLVELDLSGNLIEVVPSRAFMDSPSLMRLSLSLNPIKRVNREAFSHLYYLNTLEMSDCEVGELEVGAFQGLHSLEWLRLNGNRLRGVVAGVFPENLRGVELQGNEWECDCHLLDLHEWLETFSIPQDVEPVCAGPKKLERRPVKSIQRGELACLPEVSPTTFYLEIGEGKNVSLLCQINAIPEAHVSWWFQGQLLQNDTMVSSDTRLIYYIEEGVEEKRSELFIYNTNTQDNGTFICSAENPAGLVLSNFTIRIILREEPHYQTEVIPYEFLLIIVSATGVSFVIICFALILSIIKCQREKLRKDKEHRQNLTLSNSTKDSLLQDSIEEYSDISKEDSNITLADRQQMLLYSTQTSEELLRSISPLSNQIRSPPSLSCYQVEQNPDLINGTETLPRRREGDGVVNTIENYELSLPPVFLQQNCDLYHLAADVHLNPITLLNASPTCYRTLPYNRTPKKRQSLPKAAEAEFMPQPASYELYPVDVRYTADGYPAKTEETQFSDTDSVKSCCSSQKKSVVAQTQTDPLVATHSVNKPVNRSVCSAVKISETLTESPDEGYEGDSVINSKH